MVARPQGRATRANTKIGDWGKRVDDVCWGRFNALGGSRTHNRLIRSQALYPLSYEGTT